LTAEESLARAEELLARLEATRVKLEETTDQEAALELLDELSQLAKDVQAQIEQAKRETDAES
jgi:hypothetical protein